MTKREIVIPFAGFYDSIWTQAIDIAEEVETYNFREQHGSNVEMFAYINYSEVFQKVARDYVASFCRYLESEHALTLYLELAVVESPREYNFVTDRIFVWITDGDLRALISRVSQANVALAAKAKFTSRKGFISFYSPDITTWGDVYTWDHNKLSVLFDALIIDDDQEDMDYWLIEDMQENVAVAVESATDWTRLELDHAQSHRDKGGAHPL